MISLLIHLVLLMCVSVTVVAEGKEPLRLLTWEGYVQPQELAAVNQLLEQAGYPYEAVVIEPLAEGADQMFNIIRRGGCDISFLTLFFIKMDHEQTSRLLQPINTRSPRLGNYRHLIASLTHIPMGVVNEQPLYIPWGGGVYGFYYNAAKVPASEVPQSVQALWTPQWRHRFSLNQSQPWYNVGLALMSMGLPPFEVQQLARAQNRQELLRLSAPGSPLQQRVTALYDQAGHFWTHSPAFRDDLLIVSSWGPEITRENQQGAHWRPLEFREGRMVWLDTINFVKGLSGRKLEAAEIVANYFIGPQVQTRIGKTLSMIPASALAEDADTQTASAFFATDYFVPPFDDVAHSLMKGIYERAMQARQMQDCKRDGGCARRSCCQPGSTLSRNVQAGP